jgi:response regulator RpfG family c-di-GMP phosphodiesterase
MSTEQKTTATTMTVLCVDDELNILKSLKRLLRKQNYQLLLAESAVTALEIMQQQDVNLIMSDMKMPAMSGAQLLEKVSTSYPNTYRILLTGYSDQESTVNAVNKGQIHRFLQKPWDNNEITRAIEEGLLDVRLKQALINNPNTNQ